MRRSASILVIEDNADMADLYRVTLEPLGYELHVGSSGSEARELLRSRRIDAVVLDLVLPWGGGIPVLAQLRADPDLRALKVILVSGRNDVDQVAREHHADAYLRKPFDMVSLIALLQHLVPQQRDA